MKTKLLLTLTLILGLSYVHEAQDMVVAAMAPGSEYPLVEIVVTPERVWLLPDEMPVDKLPVRVLDEKGDVILKKDFSSKCEDWSLDVSDLPGGKYKILVGSIQTAYLEKPDRIRML
ncbi:MAG: hypothetical protein EP344_09450 [Bacteroidetes bacterium]|nr:MAG: hypothetical protein EP344_09450 [Bacteroidota bacterium]